MQSRGFNGFSYADVAAELGVTKASLHYHFPSKAELGEALIARYAQRASREALSAIDAGAGRRARASSPPTRSIYGDVLRDRRMCLCGMLAADYETLPEPMRGRHPVLRRERGLARARARAGRATRARCASRVAGTPRRR